MNLAYMHSGYYRKSNVCLVLEISFLIFIQEKYSNILAHLACILHLEYLHNCTNLVTPNYWIRIACVLTIRMENKSFFISQLQPCANRCYIFIFKYLKILIFVMPDRAQNAPKLMYIYNLYVPTS